MNKQSYRLCIFIDLAFIHFQFLLSYQYDSHARLRPNYARVSKAMIRKKLRVLGGNRQFFRQFQSTISFSYARRAEFAKVNSFT